jgi:hypothetical protein
VGLQFLEVHEAAEAIAGVVRVEGVLGPAVADCLIDVATDTDAQRAVAVTGVERLAALRRLRRLNV